MESSCFRAYEADRSHTGALVLPQASFSLPPKLDLRLASPALLRPFPRVFPLFLRAKREQPPRSASSSVVVKISRARRVQPSPPLLSCSPGQWKPDVLCTGIVGTRGSMVIRLRPCMISSTPRPLPPLPRSSVIGLRFPLAVDSSFTPWLDVVSVQAAPISFPRGCRSASAHTPHLDEAAGNPRIRIA